METMVGFFHISFIDSLNPTQFIMEHWKPLDRRKALHIHLLITVSVYWGTFLRINAGTFGGS